MKRTTTTGTASRRSQARAAAARIRKRLRKVVTPRDLAALDADRPTVPPTRPFDVLDPVMQARTHVEGTLAIMSELLGADLDEAAILTMERHLQSDWQRLTNTLDAAWAALVQGGAK